MQVLQRNKIDRFTELEFGEFIADDIFSVLPITSVLRRLLKGYWPDFQHVTFAAALDCAFPDFPLAFFGSSIRAFGWSSSDVMIHRVADCVDRIRLVDAVQHKVGQGDGVNQVLLLAAEERVVPLVPIFEFQRNTLSVKVYSQDR